MSVFTLGPKLAQINRQDSVLGSVLQQLASGLTRLAKNTNSSASGPVAAPHPPTGMNVSIGTDGLHYSIEHPGEIQRGIRYFSEIAKDPAFSQVVAIRDHGASRTPAPVSLPAKDSTGSQHAYYLRAYAQYAGSEPSAACVYGGASPEPIMLTGSSQMDFAPSTGSGTASNSGGQPGFGLGRFATRAQ